MTTEVVITGTGAVTPLGVGARTLIDRWSAGEHGFSDGLGRCRDFAATDFLSVKEARRTDRFTQLAIAAADEALDAAGWDGSPPFDPRRIACMVGTGVGGMETLEGLHDTYRDQGVAALSPLGVPRLMGNAASAALAMRYGLHGPSGAIVSACAAGADAIAAGARLIRSGEADAVVAGGSESALSPFVQGLFAAMNATSRRGVCLPFDSRRDGFLIGEGAGVLVLERADAAQERNAPVLGRLLGAGISSDAFHLTAPDPDAGHAADAITSALANASISGADVDYVNAHGTGTQLNDRAETQAIKGALGTRAHQIPVSSTKSAIGHLLGAAGAVEAVAALLALRRGIAPPTIGYEEQEEGLDLDYVGDGPRELAGDGEHRTAISNSFGFGGHNVVLVLQSGAPHHPAAA